VLYQYEQLKPRDPDDVITGFKDMDMLEVVEMLSNTDHEDIEGNLDVFVDGGMLGANKKGVGCVDGGTVAVVITKDGKFITAFSALVRRASDKPGVTNNDSEIMAFILALRLCRNGTIKSIQSDSLNAISRVRKVKLMLSRGVMFKEDEELRESMGSSRYGSLVAVVNKHKDSFRTVHLKGHPSEEAMVIGTNETNQKVSVWNDFCDRLCNSRKDRWKKEREQSQTSEGSQTSKT